MKEYCSLEAQRLAKEDMEMIRLGKIRNHMIKNSALGHNGAVEKKEYYHFQEFLPTKNFDFVYNLRGSDNCE